MTKPEWQDWGLEPWEVGPQAYVYRRCEDGDQELMFDAWYVGAHEACRLVACVNALAGVRNPPAIARLVEAARDVAPFIHPITRHQKAAEKELYRALAAIDQPEPQAEAEEDG